MEGDWAACPYQRYFEEQNRRRRDDQPLNSHHHSAGSASPTSTESGGSTASTVSTMSTTSTASTASTVSTVSTGFENKCQNEVQDTSQHEVVFCEEPEEMPNSPLENGRPKLNVLTKYIGGF